jgi:hypothetical protein
MKRILLGLMALSFVALSCKNETSPSDAAAASVQPSKKLSKAEIDKAYADYATPGDMQKWMASSDGTWDADITMWMYPDSPAMKMKGVAVYKMNPDGLHQESTHTGDMGPMKFEGRSVTGYDNTKKVFVSTWYDNMGSGIMMMEGTYNDQTKTLKLKGRQVDPTQGKEMEVKELVKYIDDNTMHMEMYCEMDGKETKTMELTAKKRKM